jgi:Homeodomain-like domain
MRPRRSRCTACRVAHMLLPARLLLRRADEAAVIGAALAAAARGLRQRRIAAELEVPEDTVRGWLRRAAGRAGQVREAFTKVAAVMSADPVPLEPAGSPLADAGVAAAAAGRWPRLLAVQRILRTTSGWAPSDRTLQRLFSRLELNAPPADPGQQQVFGRFQAARPNELWTGDALHGPVIGGRKAFLFWNLPWLSSGRPGG